MVGSAIKGLVTKQKDLSTKYVFLSSNECDLRDQVQTSEMFKEHKPKQVIHLAAKVGGVKGNTDYVADFYTDNITINTNILQCSFEYKVQKVISLLSTCIYPDEKYVAYPLSEEQIHNGPPHESNFGYAYAKRMLEVQTRAYNKQYKTSFMCAIPNNIFGEHDNFDLNNGHVVPSIIRKVWEAKQNNKKEVVVWGDGSPLREFTYSKDIAKILLFLLSNQSKLENPVINIGNTNECSILEITNKIKKILKYDGEIVFDTTKPNGQHKKPSTNIRLHSLGFDTKKEYTNIDIALKNTCDWFMMSYPFVRGV